MQQQQKIARTFYITYMKSANLTVAPHASGSLSSKPVLWSVDAKAV